MRLGHWQALQGVLLTVIPQKGVACCASASGPVHNVHIQQQLVSKRQTVYAYGHSKQACWQDIAFA